MKLTVQPDYDWPTILGLIIGGIIKWICIGACLKIGWNLLS